MRASHLWMGSWPGHQTGALLWAGGAGVGVDGAVLDPLPPSAGAAPVQAAAMAVREQVAAP